MAQCGEAIQIAQPERSNSGEPLRRQRDLGGATAALATGRGDRRCVGLAAVKNLGGAFQ
jgi:hypothetical protein